MCLKTVGLCDSADTDQMMSALLRLKEQSDQGLHCLHKKQIFFFYLGFTALSRIFHLYRADRSSKDRAKTGEPGEKTT